MRGTWAGDEDLGDVRCRFYMLITKPDVLLLGVLVHQKGLG